MTSKPTNQEAILVAFGLRLPHYAIVVFPQLSGIDWVRVARDVTQPLVCVNRVSEAYRLCALGQPSIAFLGVSKRWLTKWLKARGSNPKDLASAH